MRRIFLFIGLALVLAYLSVCGFIYAPDRPVRYTRATIVVTDSDAFDFVHAADIRQQMQKAGFRYRGKTIDSVNTWRLSQLIEQNRLVRKANCYHTPDSTLRIEVSQRHPIMRVKSITEGDFFIDTDGETMPAHTAAAIRLPLVTGYASHRLVDRGLYDFAKFLQKDRFWRTEITQIWIDAKGEVYLVPRVGNHTILLGSFDNYETKLARLLEFYKKVMPRKGWNAYSVLNLKFDGQVIGERNEK